MELGAFSVSLSVTDLEKSRAFYETLGFAQVGGDSPQVRFGSQPDDFRFS